jgi:hypothetical protein
VITFPRRIIEELINELRRWRDFPDEISRYGTLKTWATRLGLKDAATLLATICLRREDFSAHALGLVYVKSRFPLPKFFQGAVDGFKCIVEMTWLVVLVE